MKSLPFCALLLTPILVAPAYAVIERTVEKTYTVSGAGIVHLQTSGGGIRVQPGADGTVKIVARQRIRAGSESEADELLKNLELKFDQQGNDVHASAKYNRNGSWFSSTPVSVEFIATVPASYGAELRTSGGGLTVGDLNGDVDVRTSGGGIKLGKLGGRVDARTSGGGISLTEARGETNLDTSGGSINVGRVAGPADLSTSGGSITIESVEQRVHANTSGGSIRAGIKGPLEGDCTLSTSGGGVNVTVDKSAAFRLDASTSGGSVRADGLTITLEASNQNRSKLSGSVNGGGPTLKLRSSGGSISVSAR